MSYDSAPRICPRCRGRLFEGFDGEYSCLQCGCVVYIPDEPRPWSYLREPIQGTQSLNDRLAKREELGI